MGYRSAILKNKKSQEAQLVYALIVLLVGLATLYKAFREQRSLETATTTTAPADQDPRRVMVNMRLRYQGTITPLWVLGWFFSGVGVVFIVLSLL